MADDFVPIPTAARSLGISVDAIDKRIARGQISASDIRREGRTRLIRLSALTETDSDKPTNESDIQEIHSDIESDMPTSTPTFDSDTPTLESDMAELRADLEHAMAELRRDVSACLSELSARVSDALEHTESRTRKDVSDLRQELRDWETHVNEITLHDPAPVTVSRVQREERIGRPFQAFGNVLRRSG